MRRNSVPLDGRALPFAEYRQKLEHLLHAVAYGHLPKPEVAWEAHEPWLGQGRTTDRTTAPRDVLDTLPGEVLCPHVL